MEFLKPILLEHVAKPYFATVSGAHLYGFSSPDSDFDVRGAHLRPLPEVLSLFPGRETIEMSKVVDGREIDLVSHDVGKFFALMLRKNGYVMEQIFSPLVVFGELDELRDIARGCITKHIYHHYRGFADNHLRQYEGESAKKAKTLLYLYRVLLTGIHVLRTGEIEANLPKLLEICPQPGVADLIAAKTRELGTVDPGAHEARIRALRAELDAAHASCALPEMPRRAEDLDALLVRLRMQG